MTLSVLVILFLASLIQGAAGFGFALFAMPLLLLVGIKTPEAVALSSASTLFQTGLASFQLRQYIIWPKVWWATSVRLLTLPVGIYLLYQLDGLNINQVKQIIGGLILAIVILQILWRPQPSKTTKTGEITAMAASGILMGFSGMSGPPLVLWVMQQSWQPKQIRAFLLTTFFMGIPFVLSLLYFTYGNRLLESFIQALLAIPVVVLATQLGVALGNRLNRRVLQCVTYAMLALTALSAILSPLL